MKSHILILLIPILLAMPAAAQSEHAVLLEIESALESGDVSALSRHSSERIELTLFGVSSVYSRSQAMYVLTEFFREYQPGRTILDEPSRSGSDSFVLGEYHYLQAEQPLRVFLRLKNSADRWELREIRFEAPAG